MVTRRRRTADAGDAGVEGAATLGAPTPRGRPDRPTDVDVAVEAPRFSRVTDSTDGDAGGGGGGGGGMRGRGGDDDGQDAYDGGGWGDGRGGDGASDEAGVRRGATNGRMAGADRFTAAGGGGAMEPRGGNDADSPPYGTPQATWQDLTRVTSVDRESAPLSGGAGASAGATADGTSTSGGGGGGGGLRARASSAARRLLRSAATPGGRSMARLAKCNEEAMAFLERAGLGSSTGDVAYDVESEDDLDGQRDSTAGFDLGFGRPSSDDGGRRRGGRGSTHSGRRGRGGSSGGGGGRRRSTATTASAAAAELAALQEAIAADTAAGEAADNALADAVAAAEALDAAGVWVDGARPLSAVGLRALPSSRVLGGAGGVLSSSNSSYTISDADSAAEGEEEGGLKAMAGGATAAGMGASAGLPDAWKAWAGAAAEGRGGTGAAAVKGGGVAAADDVGTTSRGAAGVGLASIDEEEGVAAPAGAGGRFAAAPAGGAGVSRIGRGGGGGSSAARLVVDVTAATGERLWGSVVVDSSQLRRLPPLPRGASIRIRPAPPVSASADGGSSDRGGGDTAVSGAVDGGNDGDGDGDGGGGGPAASIVADAKEPIAALQEMAAAATDPALRQQANTLLSMWVALQATASGLRQVAAARRPKGGDVATGEGSAVAAESRQAGRGSDASSRQSSATANSRGSGSAGDRRGSGGGGDSGDGNLYAEASLVAIANVRAAADAEVAEATAQRDEVLAALEGLLNERSRSGVAAGGALLSSYTDDLVRGVAPLALGARPVATDADAYTSDGSDSEQRRLRTEHVHLQRQVVGARERVATVLADCETTISLLEARERGMASPLPGNLGGGAPNPSATSSGARTAGAIVPETGSTELTGSEAEARLRVQLAEALDDKQRLTAALAAASHAPASNNGDVPSAEAQLRDLVDSSIADNHRLTAEVTALQEALDEATAAANAAVSAAAASAPLSEADPDADTARRADAEAAEQKYLDAEAGRRMLRAKLVRERSAAATREDALKADIEALTARLAEGREAEGAHGSSASPGEQRRRSSGDGARARDSNSRHDNGGRRETADGINGSGDGGDSSAVASALRRDAAAMASQLRSAHEALDQERLGSIRLQRELASATATVADLEQQLMDARVDASVQASQHAESTAASAPASLSGGKAAGGGITVERLLVEIERIRASRRHVAQSAMAREEILVAAVTEAERRAELAERRLISMPRDRSRVGGGGMLLASAAPAPRRRSGSGSGSARGSGSGGSGSGRGGGGGAEGRVRPPSAPPTAAGLSSGDPSPQPASPGVRGLPPSPGPKTGTALPRGASKAKVGGGLGARALSRPALALDSVLFGGSGGGGAKAGRAHHPTAAPDRPLASPRPRSAAVGASAAAAAIRRRSSSAGGGSQAMKSAAEAAAMAAFAATDSSGGGGGGGGIGGGVGGIGGGAGGGTHTVAGRLVKTASIRGTRAIGRVTPSPGVRGSAGGGTGGGGGGGGAGGGGGGGGGGGDVMARSASGLAARTTSGLAGAFSTRSPSPSPWDAATAGRVGGGDGGGRTGGNSISNATGPADGAAAGGEGTRDRGRGAADLADGAREKGKGKLGLKLMKRIHHMK